MLKLLAIPELVKTGKTFTYACRHRWVKWPSIAVQGDMNGTVNTDLCFFKKGSDRYCLWPPF